MAEINCPYCGNKKIFSIAYAVRGIKDCNENHINENSGTVFRKKGTRNEIINSLGKKIYVKRNNKYCSNCEKDFKTKRVMSTDEMSKLVIIFGNNNNRNKLVIDLYKKMIKLIKNYINVRTENISNLDIIEIYDLLDKMNFKEIENNLDNESLKYWNIKIEYINGLSDFNYGTAVIPIKIIELIKIFNKVINLSEYIKLMEYNIYTKTM